MPPVLYIEKTEVTVSDRTLVSVGPTRSVSGSVKDAGAGRWRGVSGPADVAAHRGDAE